MLPICSATSFVRRILLNCGSFCHQWIVLSVLLLINLPSYSASNSSIVYQGRVVRPDGFSINSGSLTFTLSVYSPTPSKCLLYSETQTLDMTGSQGMFSLPLGTGTRTDGGTHSFNQAFVNGLTLSGLTCDSGTSYTSGSTDDRSLAVSFNDAGTVVNLSSMAIKSVPFALQAHEIDGWGLNNLVKVSSIGSPTTFTTAEMANVKMLGAAACATNEILKWNGSGWLCSTDVSGGSPTDATYAAKGVVQADTDAATSGLSLASGVLKVNYGTGANQIVKLDASSKLPAVDGSALTNLSATNISTGTLAITHGGTGAGTKTAAFDNLSPNTTKGDLIVSDGTNNIRLPRGSDGQVLTTDSAQTAGVKWANASAGTVTRVIGGTGLTGGTITSTGTLAVDVGTGANQVVQLDASSKLPTVDGSALTNLSATQITAGTLPVSKGGTGASSFAANNLVGTNGTGSALQAVTCTQNQVLSFDASGSYGCYNLSSLAGGTYFANGGNSFGSAASLGTNDSNTLSFKTNGTVAMTIDTAGYVGIGTTAPTTPLEVFASTTGWDSRMRISRADAKFASWYNSTSNGEYRLAFFKSRGSYASPLAVQDGDTLSNVATNGNDGTSAYYAATQIVTSVDGAVSTGHIPGKIEFQTADTSSLSTRMTIRGNGHIGIGTTDPLAKLDVVDGIVGIRSSTMSPSVTMWGMSADNYPGQMVFQASRSAGASYSVSGDTLGAIEFRSLLGGYADTAARISAIATENQSPTANGGALVFATTPNTTKTPLERMRIGSDGRVGIGTTSPQFQMHLSDDATSIGVGIEIADTSGDAASRNWLIGNSASPGFGQLEFIASSTIGTNPPTDGSGVVMHLEPSGKVGIGNRAPSHRLHVEDSQASDAVAFFNNTDAGASAKGIIIQVGAATPGTGNDFVLFQKSGGTVIGQIEAASGTTVQYTTTSDRRLKENIRDTHFTIDDLMKIQVRDYNYKSNSKDMTGFIAQDLYEVYPYAVSKPEDESRDFWGVDYGLLSPLLVKSIQDLYHQFRNAFSDIVELKTQAADQSRQMASVQKRTAKLEAENAELKANVEKAEKEKAAQAKEMAGLKARMERLEKMMKEK